MLYVLFFAFLQTGRYREARKIIEVPTHDHKNSKQRRQAVRPNMRLNFLYFLKKHSSDLLQSHAIKNTQERCAFAGSAPQRPPTECQSNCQTLFVLAAGLTRFYVANIPILCGGAVISAD